MAVGSFEFPVHESYSSSHKTAVRETPTTNRATLAQKPVTNRRRSLLRFCSSITYAALLIEWVGGCGGGSVIESGDLNSWATAQPNVQPIEQSADDNEAAACANCTIIPSRRIIWSRPNATPYESYQPAATFKHDQALVVHS